VEGSGCTCYRTMLKPFFFSFSFRAGQLMLRIHRSLRLIVQGLRPLVTGMSQRKSGFDAGSVRAGFVVDKLALRQAFLTSTSALPCHYHSTNAPYSFIHLPPTLYNVFLPVLQFPLSVSFYQCSIPIHSSTTDTVYCFSPSTSVSPVTIVLPLLHTHSFIHHGRLAIANVVKQNTSLF
jgi:hypothetical protein